MRNSAVRLLAYFQSRQRWNDEGACSIVVLVAGGKRSSRIPFGPALVLGVCVTMLGR